MPRERTFRTKLLEFWGAFCLEQKINKDEILELYLNRAPFGGNIRGIEAASNAYFNKKAEFLSLAESVSLISMLSAPSKYRLDRFPEKNEEIRNIKLDYLVQRKFISQENADLAKLEKIFGIRYPMKNEAAMAMIHVKQYSPESPVLRSTLDKNYQLLLEKNLSEALKNYPERITAAGIIVHNPTGEVRAYVGNSRHGTSLPGAQVDCAASARSPGSTLKPFIYALAFEKGLMTPASLLADTPLSFMGRAPRNFDMTYRGPVSARNALASSLNAPAVRVLRLVGYAAAKSILNRFGFELIREDPMHYTDSLILGGCEITLLQLAAAYRSLAVGGSYSRLSWNENSTSSSTEIISPEAAYLVTDILQDEKRLIPIYQEIFQNKNAFIAFKTGTSYGFRDGWCIGYTEEYTVAVWVGSPSGMGDSLLVGLTSAAPIMLKVTREIMKDQESPFHKPHGIITRNVCALSGALPTINCPQIIEDLAIKDISRNVLCTLHKKIDENLFVNWPKEFNDYNLGSEENYFSHEGIKIIRPVAGHAVILKNKGEKERIFLSAEGEAPHYWYLDGKFIGVSHDGKGLFTDVAQGLHKASVLSMEFSDAVSFEVKTPGDINEVLRGERDYLLNP
jgi:penicillin-binding protein 1C